jgi:hypothetical protein
MVQTTHFGGQTSLLVPTCFILIQRNSIEMQELLTLAGGFVLCQGFAVPPVEKPVRVYRFATSKSDPGREQNATFLPT